MPFKSIRS